MYRRNGTSTLKTRFVNEMYDGDRKAYLRARRDDYCKVQLEWTCYMDDLCKNGEITQKQYDMEIF